MPRHRSARRAAALTLAVAGYLGAAAGALPRRLGAQSPSADTVTAAGDSSLAAQAHARATRRGATVAVIDVRDVDLATVRTLSDLLASRVPGVTVRRTSGGAGAGAGVWMRGPAGIDGTRTTTGTGIDLDLWTMRSPLLVVDGVRTDNTQRSLAIQGYAAAPSRLDDYRLEDLATVEVLRGPAAAALYGAGAERGVIVLTTRGAERGATHVGLSVRSAAVTNAAHYAPLYGRVDLATGQLDCTLDRGAAGLCTPGPVIRRAASVAEAGFESQVEKSVGGYVQGTATSRIAYYAGGGIDDRPGLYAENDLRQTSGRTRLDARVASSLDLTASGSYTGGVFHLPFLSSAVDNPLRYALLAPADGGVTRPDDPLTPYVLRQRLAHGTAVATLSWRPAAWLTSRLTYGNDDAKRDEQRPDVADAYGAFHQGAAGRVRSTTLRASAQSNYSLRPALDATTTAAVERVARFARDSSEEIGWGTDGVVREWRRQWIKSRYTLLGISIAQRFSWRDRLTMDLGFRDDHDTRTDRHVGLQRSAELSWAVPGPGASGWRRLWSSGGRLRAAYGFVQLPRPRDAGAPVGGFGDYIAAAGSRPEGEHTREVELGGEGKYIGGRLGVSLTGYDKLTSHSPVLASAATPYGYFLVLVDGLDVRNRGLELAIDAQLLNGSRLSWDAGLTFAANRNRVDRLRAPPYAIADVGGGYTGRFVFEGKPLGAWASHPILSYADRNGDGVITSVGCWDDYSGSQPGNCDEVTFADSFGLSGTPYPTRDASLSSSLGFGRHARLSVRLDYRGGIQLYNHTRSRRCVAPFGNCREMYDSSSPLADQARVVASRFDGGMPYVEDAGYVKLRDVSLTFDVPERWVHPAAGRLTVTAAVRNLATWTRYSGGDPEVSSSVAPLSGTDSFAQAQSRSFVLRVEAAR